MATSYFALVITFIFLMQFLFKKYLEYEKSFGDEERIEYVKRKAMEYVESTNAWYMRKSKQEQPAQLVFGKIKILTGGSDMWRECQSLIYTYWRDPGQWWLNFCNAKIDVL